jgi:hypothetical protein
LAVSFAWIRVFAGYRIVRGLALSRRDHGNGSNDVFDLVAVALRTANLAILVLPFVFADGEINRELVLAAFAVVIVFRHGDDGLTFREHYSLARSFPRCHGMLSHLMNRVFSTVLQRCDNGAPKNDERIVNEPMYHVAHREDGQPGSAPPQIKNTTE